MAGVPHTSLHSWCRGLPGQHQPGCAGRNHDLEAKILAYFGEGTTTAHLKMAEAPAGEGLQLPADQCSDASQSPCQRLLHQPEQGTDLGICLLSAAGAAASVVGMHDGQLSTQPGHQQAQHCSMTCEGAPPVEPAPMLRTALKPSLLTDLEALP